MSVKNGIAKKIIHAAIILVISVAMSLLFSACAPNGDGEEHTHEYVNYTYNNDATCVADGTETGKCKYCDKTDTRVSAAHPATGVHTFTDYTYNNDATCVTDGTETATCANCSATDTRTSAAHPATGVHTYDATDRCTMCGRQKPTGSEQCAHSYSIYVYNNDATCVTDGTETATCANCSATDTRTSAAHPATGVHTFVNDVCTGCGEYNPNIVVTQGLKFTEITENNEVVGYELSGIGSVTDTEIIIPKAYNGKPVTSIGDAFYDCSYLTNITIPNSVMSIGDFAFYHCSNLTNISIPSSVIRIGYGAFVGCNRLTSIMISSGVTSIGSLAFVDCSSLTSITIPNSVTSIGSEVFVNCGLTSITIPDSVTSIGAAVFYGCSSLTSVTVATGNNKYHSVGNCIIETLTKTLIAGHEKSVIPMDGSVTSIGKAAFICSSFTSITIPNSVTSIGEKAFFNCRNLTSIAIPNSVTSIGSMAFGDCRSLMTITIPSGVTSIGGGTFGNCSSLTSITIPNSVTSIGDYAFSGCSSLTSITVESGNSVYHSAGNCLIEIESKTLIAGCKASIIPSDGSVTSIGENAFRDCSNLTSITIPNSVTSIGKCAFFYCSNLTSIAIPNSVTSIGGSAFAGCDSLTIYCEAESTPSGWSFSWNHSNCSVVWGYKNN